MAYSISKYLISGATSANQMTGVAKVLGMSSFSLTLSSSNFQSSVPATGQYVVEAQLESSAPYGVLFSAPARGITVSGLHLDGPFENIRTRIDPFITGVFTVVARYS